MLFTVLRPTIGVDTVKSETSHNYICRINSVTRDGVIYRNVRALAYEPKNRDQWHDDMEMIRKKYGKLFHPDPILTHGGWNNLGIKKEDFVIEEEKQPQPEAELVT